ncbi:MAG: TerB family tellurite resistance protein [Acidobacteriota bacterium]
MALLGKLFGLEGSSPPELLDQGAQADAIRSITEALDRMDPERARFIASFAYILGRVAHADRGISEEETRVMERIVSERGALPEEQAILVVQIAKTQNLLFGGTENFIVTREFNRLATREQKLAMLDCLFSVSAADGSVSTREDNEVRIIADELKLDHSDFIAARSAYRDYLAVLKERE